MFQEDVDRRIRDLKAADDFRVLGDLCPRGVADPSAKQIYTRIIERVMEDVPGRFQSSPAVLFSHIKRWALEGVCTFGSENHQAEIIKNLSPGEKRMFKAKECRQILAAAFFGFCRDPMRNEKDSHCRGGLDFDRLYFSIESEGAQKLAALLVYFEVAIELQDTEDDNRVVEFEYVQCPSMKDFETSIKSSDVCVAKASHAVQLHDGFMEDKIAHAFVNFANRNFGYGKFIPSATQEEILQMCCPEFNVGMLFIGIMKEDSVVVVHGCRRFSHYSGYLNTYKCLGRWDIQRSPTLQSIVTMDATFQRHMQKDQVLRDTRKAFAGFQAVSRKFQTTEVSQDVDRGNASRVIISTGRWGCGVFGGLPSHKFLLQVLAASLADCELRFSVFGTPDGCDDVLTSLQSNEWEEKLSPIDVLNLLIENRMTNDSYTSGVLSALSHQRRGASSSQWQNALNATYDTVYNFLV